MNWSTILRGIRKRGDDLTHSLQSYGLEKLAEFACNVLDEPMPTGGSWLPWEYQVLDALLDRMCAYRGDLPRPADTYALEATLDFVDTLPHGRRQQLRQLLAVFEAGPRLLAPEGRRERFSRLEESAADRYLSSWDQSRLPPRRAAFNALKSVCMMGYWSQSETWPAVGFSLEENPGLES